MITIPVTYIFFLVLILLQGLTVIMFSTRLKSMEELIRRNNIESKEQVKFRNHEEEEPTLEKPEHTIINEPVDEVQNNEDILFIKEIKLDKGSHVIDMDVHMNRRN